MGTARMRESIAVIIYSFQNKDLLASVSNVIDNSSSLNDIVVYVIDQNNINRKDIFESKFDNSVKYLFVPWDKIKSPIWYKENFAKKTLCNYILHLGDRVSLSKNWDSRILEKYTEPNLVFSGNNVSEIYIKNNYFLDTKKIEDNYFFKQGLFIDRNFIFSRKSNLIDIGYPTYLKYYGEQEAQTYFVYDKAYSIYIVPEDLYSDNTIKLDELEYVPFSLTHNYNYFVESHSKIINKFLDDWSGANVKPGVSIKKIPFENNDVDYDQDKSEIDKIGGDRYLNVIREIN